MSSGLTLVLAILSLPLVGLIAAALLIVTHPDRSEEVAEEAALRALSGRARSMGEAAPG